MTRVHLHCRALGHSPAVSRAYYLAKFEGAILEDDARDEFKAAEKRARELYTQRIPEQPEPAPKRTRTAP